MKLLEMGGVITELKKLSVVVLRTPSALPVLLLNVRTLPLMTTRNCVGPTAPMESGGKPLVSARVAAVKLSPTVCESGEIGEPGVDDARADIWFGHCRPASAGGALEVGVLQDLHRGIDFAH